VSEPNIYLSNWSSHAREGHHGPGRKLSGMTEDRRPWEYGDGLVRMVEPNVEKLRAVKSGRMAIRDYLLAYDRLLSVRAQLLPPGELRFLAGGDFKSVEDGDSILCACAAVVPPDPLAVLFALPDLSRHPCHLEVLAPALVRAGWAVILYGVRLEWREGLIYREGAVRPYTWEPL
jgi:hypothetical protein